MKKCVYCGKEYPDDASVCAIDQQSLRLVNPPLLNQPVFTPAGDAQQIIDNEHLKMLVIFHYVVAGLALLGLLFLCLHAAVMLTVFSSPAFSHSLKNQSGPPSVIFLPIMVIFYTIFSGMMITVGILNLLSARFLKQRKHRTFSLVVAGIDCLQIPFGTVLGVFTIIVLSRNSVREKYGS